MADKFIKCFEREYFVSRRQKKFIHIFAPDAEAVAGDASDDFIRWGWGRTFDLPNTRLLGG